jgi:Flp pilus assembly pilin Flp
VISRINVLIGEILGTPEFLRERLRREDGQAFVEYTLVILLIAVFIATGVLVEPFQNALREAFQKIGDAIRGAIPA